MILGEAYHLDCLFEFVRLSFRISFFSASFRYPLLDEDSHIEFNGGDFIGKENSYKFNFTVQSNNRKALSTGKHSHLLFACSLKKK